MVNFQTQVYRQQAIGLPGELRNDSPYITETYKIRVPNANDPAVFGRFFTLDDTTTSPSTVIPGDSGNKGPKAYVGLLVNPKQHVSFGNTVDGPLGPSYSLPSGTLATFCKQGKIIVDLPGTTAAQEGWLVIFNKVNGILSAINPSGGVVPGGWAYANAVVRNAIGYNADMPVGTLYVAEFIPGTQENYVAS